MFDVAEKPLDDLDDLHGDGFEFCGAAPMSTGELLELAVTLPPGQAASVLAGLDPGHLDDDGRLTLAQSWARVEAAAAAGKLAAAAAVRSGPDPSTGPPLVDGRALEVGAGLCLGPVAAARMLAVADTLRDDLPAVASLLAAGTVSYLHVVVAAEAAATLPAEVRGAFDRAVADKAPGRTVGQLRAVVRRLVARLDAEGVARRARQAAVDDTDVHLHHQGDDATATVAARMPVLDAKTVTTAVEAYARAAKAAGDPRTLGQLRAAALVAWATGYLTGRPGPSAAGPNGPPTQHGRPVMVHITVPLTTVLGLSDTPGTVLPDGAAVPARAVRDLLAEHPLLHRLVYDELTGHLLDYGRSTYRAPADLAAFVTFRHVTATGPTSTAPATGCDLDHLVDFHTGGPTDPTNLHPPDRRWHNAHTHGGWTPTLGPDGTVTWTSPLGRTYDVPPWDYRA